MDTRTWGVAGALLLLACSGPARAADKPVTKAPAPAVFDWTGFYLGGEIGGGRGKSSIYDPFGVGIFGDFVPTPGPIAGVRAGANYQVNSWVLGAEGSFDFADMDGTNTCFDVSGVFFSANCRAHTHLLGTATGRLGMVVGPQGRTLIYGKGGAAWMREDVDMLVNVSPAGANFASGAAYGQWGWTAGAGAEHALGAHWLVSFEYDFLQFGRHDVATPVSAITGTLCTPHGGCFVMPIGHTGGESAGMATNVHLTKLGLSYKLGPDSPASPANGPFLKAPAGTPPPGWAVEAGARYWYTRGRFEKNFGAGADNPSAPDTLESRLTYDDMFTHAGEVFGRIDTPLKVFVKGNIGKSFALNGRLNDEDWLAFPLPLGGTVPYSNTLSRVRGRISYDTGDLGFTFAGARDYRLSAFAGYNELREHMEASGCVQLASLSLAAPCVPPFPLSVLGIIEESRWRSLRTGLTGDVMLAPRVKLNGDFAWLPYVRYDAVDTHLLGTFGPRIFPANGRGTGVELEAILSYLVTEQFSLGVGGRYWAMWTVDGSRLCENCTAVGSIGAPTSFRAATEQLGVFVQAGYTFDGTIYVKN